MAGLVEIGEEIIEEMEDFEAFSAEEAEAEEAEEFESLLNEARMGVEELASSESFIKECISEATSYMKDALIFISKNAAIGVILFGVNYVLSKIFHGGQGKGDKAFLTLMKAVLKVVDTETNTSKSMAEWLKEHKDEMVELEGIPIPLDALLHKYFQPVLQAMDQTYTVMKSLKEKADGKVQYKVPSAGIVQQLLNSADDFLQNFSAMVTFISTNVEKFSAFRSFPVKQNDIDDLKVQIEDAKAIKI